jgi:hypothetical protein
VTDPGELPFYIDDPAVDRRQHVLSMGLDPVASAHAGCDRNVGTCSCGGLSTPPWPDYAIFEAYDRHMTEVQHAIHRGRGHDPGPEGRD